MKDKLLLTIVSFLIYYNWAILYSTFIELESWKICVVYFFVVLFIFFNNNDCWQERFLNWVILSGSIIIVLSNNLFTIYLGLELQTFPLFILISKNRLWIKSSEAGLKYFILGALSSGIFLLSCSLIFLKVGSLNLNYISNLLYFDNKELIGLLSVLLFPLFFKIGLAPFHFWIPDIYDGSNWQVISILSTIPKFSVVFIVLQLFKNYNFICVIAIVSIILGVLGALNQTKIKRLVAYSGIAHIGFLVLLFYSSDNLFLELTSFYVIIYSFTLLPIILILMRFFLSNNSFIVELQNSDINNNLENITLTILLFSLAGVPPLAGFITKWLLFTSLLNQNYYLICIICLIFSFIGAAYYLRLINFIYFKRGIFINNWKKILINPYFTLNSFNIYFISFCIYLSMFLMVCPSTFFFVYNYLFNY